MQLNTHLRKVATQHNDEAATYDNNYFENFGLYHALTLDNIKRYLPGKSDKYILDAGGGTGIWSIEIARLGYRSMLTDISEGMLKQAETKITNLGLDGLIKMHICDICWMPDFADNEFSMVLCEGDPLSYCGDYLAAIREMYRVLEPGGVLIASVDNRLSALNWLRDTKDLSSVEALLTDGVAILPNSEEEHRYPIHAFTPPELIELFKTNGLEIMRIIGKPVFAHRLTCFQSSDIEIQRRLLELELRFCDNPAYYPWGGHLEIVGRKRLNR